MNFQIVLLAEYLSNKRINATYGHTHSFVSNIILIFDIKENELTYNRQLIYQQIYIMNV